VKTAAGKKPEFKTPNEIATANGSTVPMHLERERRVLATSSVATTQLK